MIIGGMFRFWMYRVSKDLSHECRAFFVCMMGFMTECLRGEPRVVCYYREASACQKAMISEGYRVIGRSGSPLSLTEAESAGLVLLLFLHQVLSPVGRGQTANIPYTYTREHTAHDTQITDTG